MIRKRILYGLLLISLVVAADVFYLYFKDYSGYFSRRRGTFSRAALSPADDSLRQKYWLTIQNTDGFAVECGMLVPRGLRGRAPAIILLGGKATGKHAVDYALGVESAIIVAVDYAYEPRDQYTLGTFLYDLPAIRQALLDVVPAAMLVADYLCTRQDVDTNKIVLLGYSFGAPFVPAIIANDRRPAVAAMVYGGGDLRTLIRHNVRRYRGAAVSECVGMLGGILLRPLEPLRYIDGISPIPLVMINGTDDEQIPQANVRALYAKAGEPKKIIWIESRHVGPDNPALTQTIIAELKRELRPLGIL